ncbi:hypothetical protein Trydic_g21157 [Trypoxylus dichotomus]
MYIRTRATDICDDLVIIRKDLLKRHKQSFSEYYIDRKTSEGSAAASTPSIVNCALLPKTEAEAHRKLHKVYGDAVLSETTCRDWFWRFKDGDFGVDDRPREGRSKTFEETELETFLGEDPYQTQQEISTALDVTRQVISKRLHVRTVSTSIDTIEPSTAQRTDTIRAEARKSDSTASQRSASRCQPVKTYLETLKWKVLPHPPYSPDIAPCDYHLFHSMAHGLADQQFRSYEDIVGRPQKMTTFTVTIFELRQKDGKRL